MDKTLLTFLVMLLGCTLYIYNLAPSKGTEITEFESFKTQYGKFYVSSLEQEYRKSIFMKNLIKIAQHNSNPSNTYQLGVTQFADLTQKEFEETYLGLKITPEFSEEENFGRTPKSREINGDIDWVVQGKVSDIKNQGKCGSCWAFSTTGSIESAYMIKGQTVLLSEQQLVDCSGAYGNHGCNGGWVPAAFMYARDHGLKTEDQYPYQAKDQVCKESKGDYKIKSFVETTGCENMLNALSSQPISVAVDASNWSLYRGGILGTCETAINHGVLLVGATDQYWKVKNSWGTTWGQSGYIRLARGNTCSVCQYPSYPAI